MEESIITTGETAEEIAAEEAAFTLAVDGPEPEPTPEPNPEPEPAPEPEPTPEPAPRLIGGMTEEQITAALARTGNLQSTVDKMAGRMGQLMQQIESLRSNPPTTQVQQKAFDLKLDKLSSQFPELANLLREDLQAIQPGDGGETKPATAGVTQEQIEAMLSASLGQNNAKMQEHIELKVLSAVHPDWQDIIRTQDFALFRDNVLPAGVGQQLMESEDALFISRKLTEFKAWNESKAVTAASNQVEAARTQAAKTNRLRQAVLPSGGGAPTTPAPVTEEDAFAQALAAEQRRLGR